MPTQGPQAAPRSRVSARAPGHREYWSTWKFGGIPGRPAAGARGKPRAAGVQGPDPGTGGVLVDPVHRAGRRGARACARRDRAPAAPRPRIPLWERGPPGRTPAAPTRAKQPRPPTTPPPFPVPARGPRPQRGGGRRGRCGGHPNARRRAGGAPPLHRSRRPGRSSARTPYDGGGTGTNPRRPAGRPAGGGARDPPTDRAPPPPPPRGGQGWGKRPREGSGDREAGPWRGRRTNTRLPPRQGRRDA